MKKNQKIVIAVTLLIMASILIYPPMYDKMIGWESKRVFLVSHSLIYEFDITQIIVELATVGLIGMAIFILLGLKKKD